MCDWRLAAHSGVAYQWIFDAAADEGLEYPRIGGEAAVCSKLTLALLVRSSMLSASSSACRNGSLVSAWAPEGAGNGVGKKGGSKGCSCGQAEFEEDLYLFLTQRGEGELANDLRNKRINWCGAPFPVHKRGYN